MPELWDDGSDNYPSPTAKGAEILRRYTRSSWKDGTDRFFGKMVLTVEELRVGGTSKISMQEAFHNAGSISVCLESIGLPKDAFSIRQLVGLEPTLAVKRENFEFVLERLARL